MTCPGGSSRKGNEARLFPDTRVLACQEPNGIHRIQGIKASSILSTVSTLLYSQRDTYHFEYYAQFFLYFILDRY